MNQPTQRPYIGIHFKCCNAYARVYLNQKGTAYSGHCPRCASPLIIRVSDGGSKERFWEVG